jgi:hypothetical protein
MTTTSRDPHRLLIERGHPLPRLFDQPIEDFDGTEISSVNGLHSRFGPGRTGTTRTCRSTFDRFSKKCARLETRFQPILEQQPYQSANMFGYNG